MSDDVRFLEKEVNKVAFVIIAFILGPIGVDRFVRDQGGIGFLKLITLGGFGIWWLVDFIIAVTKFGKYKGNFIFREGFFCKHCKIMDSWTCGSCGRTGNTLTFCRNHECPDRWRQVHELRCGLCHNTMKYQTGIWWPEANKN